MLVNLNSKKYKRTSNVYAGGEEGLKVCSPGCWRGVFVSVYVKGAGIYEGSVWLGVCVEYVGVKYVACVCVGHMCMWNVR